VIQGVQGNIARGGSTYTFTRFNSGSAVTVAAGVTGHGISVAVFDSIATRPTLGSNDAGRTFLHRQTGDWHRWTGTAWTVLSNSNEVDVLDYGVVGNGTTDDTAAINAVFTLFDGTNSVINFPPNKTCLISGSLKLALGKLILNGRNCQIRAITAGWNGGGSGVDNGLITLFGVSSSALCEDVTIKDFRFYGTNQNQTFTPKMIRTFATRNIHILDNYFENCGWEGIWGGGDSTTGNYNYDYIVRGNTFKNIGNKAGVYVILPALQMNMQGAVATDNVFIECGIAIGASGLDLIVSNNTIRDCVFGIGVGDSRCKNVNVFGNHISIGKTVAQITGIPGQTVNYLDGLACVGGFVTNTNITFKNNVIEVNCSEQFKAINIGKYNATVTGNEIHIYGAGTAAGFGVFIEANLSQYKTILDQNNIVIDRANTTGILLSSDSSSKIIDLSSSNNFVKISNTYSATSIAYAYRTSHNNQILDIDNDRKSGGLVVLPGVGLGAVNLSTDYTFSYYYHPTRGYNSAELLSPRSLNSYALSVPDNHHVPFASFSSTHADANQQGSGIYLVSVTYGISFWGFRNKVYLLSFSLQELTNATTYFTLEPMHQDDPLDQSVGLLVTGNPYPTISAYNTSGSSRNVTIGITKLNMWGRITDITPVAAAMPTITRAFTSGNSNPIKTSNGLSFATAAPTTGWWKRGHRIYNVAPTAGGSEGWICVTAGNPGTWKTFGSIAP
jgi:hypothetical protein